MGASIWPALAMCSPKKSASRLAAANLRGVPMSPSTRPLPKTWDAQLVGLMSGRRYPAVVRFQDRSECERWMADSNLSLPPLTRWQLARR